jgi:hypothetical protein
LQDEAAVAEVEEEFALPDIAEGELLDSLVLDEDGAAEQIELSEEDLATIDVIDAFSTTAYSDEVRLVRPMARHSHLTFTLLAACG